MIKALIHFPGDPTVGIFAWFYEMELPDFDEEYREETRTAIKKLYEDLEQEKCLITFSNDPRSICAE